MSNDGLTTTRAPFIEKAQENGELYIHQPYELYSAENQRTWTRLYDSMLPVWKQYANEKFMEGLELLKLSPEKIPVLEDINQFLDPISGFKAKAVSGYVPSYLFFDCLRNRSFPTTITIRDGAKLDYLPEPDIFHDVAGHVPMHTSRRFSDVLVRFGEVAKQAARRGKELGGDDTVRIRRIESNIKAMARFFWFTVEFGLMMENGKLKAYGSGLLSSRGELEYSIESPEVQRYPLQLEWVINQYFEIDHYQPLLFVVDSFDHLFGQVDELAKWLHEGRLDNVAPGEPAINEEDLKSFLTAETEATEQVGS